MTSPISAPPGAPGEFTAAPGASFAPAYQPPADPGVGDKSFVATWLFAWLLGIFGVDRFYLGKIGTGIVKLLTFGGFGVWVLVDLILVLAGAQRDKSGRRLAGYDQHKKLAWIITGVMVALGLIIGAVTPNGSPEVSKLSSAVVAQDEEAPEVEAVVEEPSVKEAEVTAPVVPDVPTEYKSALNKAQSYSDMMHMSKAGLFDQLTSEFGEKFSVEAAQYAVDNVSADWNLNALAKAKSYQENMSMSPEAIRDQLMSEYGEKFTPDEANYAVQNLG